MQIRIRTLAAAVAIGCLMFLIGSSAYGVGTLVDSAHYVYPGLDVPNQLPDPAVWKQSGNLSPSFVLFRRDSLVMFDQDDATFLMYQHALPAITVEEVILRVTLKAAPIDNLSPAFSTNGNVAGGRVLLDDGTKRAELHFARNVATFARVLRWGLADSSQEVPWNWDNGTFTTYEVRRFTDGRISLTATSSDPTIPPASRTYGIGELLNTDGVAMVAWGVGDLGAGFFGFSEVHAEVLAFAPNTASAIRPPINADGTSRFRLGSTIPVKIGVTDANGNPVAGLAPQVSLQMIGFGGRDVTELASSSAADDGTTMRWDPVALQYVFNLSTKRSQFTAGQGLVEGRYRLVISDLSFVAPVVAEFDLRRY